MFSPCPLAGGALNPFNMKKIGILISSVLLLVGCSKPVVKTIVLTNPSEDYRENVMVEVQAVDLAFTNDARSLADTDFAELCLYNDANEPIPYQVMHYGNDEVQSIVFQATVKAKMQARYTLRKGKPVQAEKRVFARFVPERKDDFAWENDRAAYRMYGPALAPENPSNGIDLWLKKTNELIVDTFYYNEHVLGKVYHVDYGKGLDCYKVGHTAGCGGVFPVVAGQPVIGNHYDAWEVVDEGPLRVVFALTYNDYFGAEAAGQGAPVVGERFTVTCDAGAQLCRAEVEFFTSDTTGAANFSEIGAGIFLHTATSNPNIALEGDTQIGLNAGYLAYAENAVSDAGLASGRNYAAVVLPGMKDYAITPDAMLYGKANYDMEAGEPYTYYFGGGWSEWQYTTDADWFEATAYSARLAAEPMQYTVE